MDQIILGFSYCCDGRCIAEDYDENSAYRQKMEEDGNASLADHLNSAGFFVTAKSDVIGDERLRHEWLQPIVEIFVCYRSKRQIHEPAQLVE